LYVTCFYFEDEDKEYGIKVLNDVHKLIYSVYSTSTGTYEERCAKLLEIIKPMHNALMTEFRLRFPKKVD
jgi:hypothetical protein